MPCAVLKAGQVVNVIMASPSDTPPDGCSLVEILEPLHIVPVAIGWSWTGEEFLTEEGKPYVPPSPGFEASSPEAIKSALRLARITPTDLVYDLGCGDGVFLSAAADLGAQVRGIDLNPQVTDKRVAVIKGNYLDLDLSPATVIFMFLGEASARYLEKNRKFTSGTRIVTNCSPFSEQWAPAAVDGEVRLYVAP